MKVIIKKQTMVNGQTVEASDEPMEFPSEIAVQLINAQKAVLVPAPVKVRNREQAIEETIETRIAAAAEAMVALGDDRDAIEAYALEHFGIDLNKNFKPANMIKQFMELAAADEDPDE